MPRRPLPNVALTPHPVPPNTAPLFLQLPLLSFPASTAVVPLTAAAHLLFAQQLASLPPHFPQTFRCSDPTLIVIPPHHLPPAARLDREVQLRRRHDVPNWPSLALPSDHVTATRFITRHLLWWHVTIGGLSSYTLSLHPLRLQDLDVHLGLLESPPPS